MLSERGQSAGHWHSEQVFKTSSSRPCPCTLRINTTGPAGRLSQEQKGIGERALMASLRPSPPGDALEAVRADTRRLPRPPSRAASHHRGWLIPPLAGAMAARATG